MRTSVYSVLQSFLLIRLLLMFVDLFAGAYKAHQLLCQFPLGQQATPYPSFFASGSAPSSTPCAPMPDASNLRSQMHIEFQTRSSTVSGTTVRSISVEHPTPPEKFVRYKARYELEADLEYVFGEQAAQFIARNSAPTIAASPAAHSGATQQMQLQVPEQLPSLFTDLNRAVQVFNAEPAMGQMAPVSPPYEQSLATNPFLALAADAGAGESATVPAADPLLSQAKDIFFGARM